MTSNWNTGYQAVERMLLGVSYRGQVKEEIREAKFEQHLKKGLWD